MVRVRVVGAVVAVLGLALGLGLAAEPREADAAGDCWSLTLNLDPEEVAFYLLLNQYRADNGLTALSISTNLTRAASWQVYDMGTQNYFGHVNLAGQNHQERANACGYPHPSGENLAAGTTRSSAQDAFAAWKASPSHDANMLRKDYVQVGVARHYAPGSKYGWYWATSFGVAYDSTSGLDLKIAESGIRSAGLNPKAWNMATVLPGGLRVSDLQGYTAWDPLANGWYQQWGPNDFIPGGTKVGLLPIGMSMDKGRTPR